MRQRYINLAQTIFGEDGSDVIEAQLNEFDKDLKTMLQIYLKYLEKKKMTEGLPPVTVHQKNSLEEEWAFVRATCPHIPGGEALAANKFCFLASDLLLCIGSHIDSGIKESLIALNSSLSEEQVNSSSYRKGILRTCRMFKTVFNDAGDKARQAVAFAKTLRKRIIRQINFAYLGHSAALSVQHIE
ncbi:mitogen-activated protein kinase kinase kinase 4-like [Centruroides sculpturatus]|uniref:mitogen-activated protein kinase kinase kinase 4-like n=1 Tax=Centruroides sculpturatus TaxID=218467 RepID=UPI000C6ECF86|nr:mitogen-activated protein kinase kinase kinase 4-like [Centruroides sculpturatus]